VLHPLSIACGILHLRDPVLVCPAAAVLVQEEQRELANTIRVSGSILLSTVSNFLDFFKLEAVSGNTRGGWHVRLRGWQRMMHHGLALSGPALPAAAVARVRTAAPLCHC
jgi:hypothetical protein